MDVAIVIVMTHGQHAGCMRTYIYIQWNLSNPDTLGTEKSVLIREVSLFQGYNYSKPHKNGIWAGKSGLDNNYRGCPDFRES